MTRIPKDVVRAAVAAYNAKELGALLDLYRPDGRYWDPLHRQGVAGREAVGKAIAQMFASAPDEQLAIETLAGDEVYAVAELRGTGTLAAGEPFELDLTEVYEVVGGQIASCRAYFDPTQLSREILVAAAAHPTRGISVPGTDPKGRTA